MPGLSALYFPDTLPPTAAVGGLAPLLAPLSCLRCWPGDQPPPPWSELVAAGWLKPLDSFNPGPDSRRLQALLRELEGRRGEEALLFARGLAAQFSAPREETAPEVKSALRGTNDDISQEPGQEPGQQREREELWQALLLLKLAESLERGELEVEEQLRSFEAGRAALFRRLHGEDEDTGPQPAAKAPGSEPDIPQRPWRQPHRLLKAWSRLFAQAPEQPTMLVSADAEAWSLLRESAEDRVRPLITLLLPRHPMSPPATYAATPPPWQEAGRNLRAALAAVAAQGPTGKGEANDGGEAEEAVCTAGEAWNRQVKELEAKDESDRNGGPGGAGSPSRHVLEIILLPQTPLQRLAGNYQGLLALYRPR